MNVFVRVLRHLWLDAGDARRALDAAALQRLEQRIRDSESRHRGEICLCVEASLPLGYLWRQLRQRLSTDELVHARALSLFGKLRVWDTEHNNGVLIYLQLAEHRIEIVADRGLARHVGRERWQQALAAITDSFRAGRHEEGLGAAIDIVSRELERHFPAGDAARTAPGNELPDRPLLR